HVITASVTDSGSKTAFTSIIITVNVADNELVMICHLPPGNPTNRHEIMISSSDVQAHIDHGDILGTCTGNNEDKVIEQISKKQRDEMDKKNELKEKRNELKEIQNEINQLKNVKNIEDLKDTVTELISDIKEILQTLKSDFDYDKEYKEELKTEFKEIKQKIYDDLTTPEKNSIYTIDSKISILSHSDDPKSDAKKLGLDYKNGMTTVAIQLTDDNQKVLQQLSSIGTIDAKNNNNVQVTINLNDLPKLRSIQGIENIRPPFPAVQFEESLSEGVYFMNADLVQYSGITGKGIKVAVLDLSFTNNPKISDNIVEVKSFRQGVSVLPDHWDGDEALHGTAVAEIITDVAPDVELYLYSMESDIEFTAAVDEAISKNVDIIAMSAGWPNFPTDGKSPITQKIEEAVEHGIVFVVPAGNFGNKHWEGNFVDSNLNNWHDFSNTDEGLSITVTKDRIAEEKPIIAYLMWDVGLSDVADFELVLVNPLGQIVDFSANKQEKSSDNSLEYIYHIPDTEGVYSLGVLYSGDMTSPKNRPHANLEVFTVNDKLEYPVTQSSVSVPADANGAIVVGAVNHMDGVLEPYSSQGPTNNGKLAPDVVGPDGVTTLALDGKPFYGTSATTPYVAGLAALILENNPSMSPEQLLTKIQQNTEPGLFSLQNEYDYATGYGTVSASFLVEDSEVMQ
ncbi:MAG: S8 family serine peptidase, partial [Nitrosopumilaceae archaeon]